MDWTERTWKNIAGPAVLCISSDEMDWVFKTGKQADNQASD